MPSVGAGGHVPSVGVRTLSRRTGAGLVVRRSGGCTVPDGPLVEERVVKGPSLPLCLLGRLGRGGGLPGPEDQSEDHGVEVCRSGLRCDPRTRDGEPGGHLERGRGVPRDGSRPTRTAEADTTGRKGPPPGRPPGCSTSSFRGERCTRPGSGRRPAGVRRVCEQVLTETRSVTVDETGSGPRPGAGWDQEFRLSPWDRPCRPRPRRDRTGPVPVPDLRGSERKLWVRTVERVTGGKDGGLPGAGGP